MRHYLCTDQDLIGRLHRIEGQVRGVTRMVERGERPLDVLTQVAAARGALDAVALSLVAAEVDSAGADGPHRDETVAAVARLIHL